MALLIAKSLIGVKVLNNCPTNRKRNVKTYQATKGLPYLQSNIKLKKMEKETT